MKRILPILYLITLTVCPGYIMANHQGFSLYEPPELSDTSIVLDAGAIEATDAAQGFEGQCFLPYKIDQCVPLAPGGTISFTILVERVVGEVQQNGTLVSPSELVANGVVSPLARLRLVTGYTIEGTSIAGGFYPPHFHLLFNDHSLGPVRYTWCGECMNYEFNEYQIPIGWVHFGKKNKWEESPTPGENKLTIQMDPYYGDIRDSWGIIVDWGSITFGAMSPLVLVHGVAANHTSWEKGGFIDRIKEKKIPFEYENIDLAKSLRGNGASKMNAVELSPMLNVTAAMFGAKKLHLVGHSKGGLDIRYYLGSDLYRPAPLGTSPRMLSEFTISTPHHGSVLADIGEDYESSITQHIAIGLGSNSNDVLLRRAFEEASLLFTIPGALPKRPGRTDLTIQSMSKFNSKNGMPGGISYYSVGADADLDSDRTIEHNESAVMFPFFSNFSPFPTIFYNVLGNISRIEMRRVNAADPLGRIAVYNFVIPTATTTFQLNDIAVTVESSKYQPPYNPLRSYRRNHATVKSPETADLILQTIRTNFPFNLN